MLQTQVKLGKCHTQFMLPMKKSVTFTGACANEIIPSINHSFVYKAKEGRRVRIIVSIYIAIGDPVIKKGELGCH